MRVCKGSEYATYYTSGIIVKSFKLPFVSPVVNRFLMPVGNFFYSATFWNCMLKALSTSLIWVAVGCDLVDSDTGGGNTRDSQA